MNTKDTVTRKTACKCCGSDVFSYGLDFETDAPIWRCANCDTVTPRQVRISKKQRELNKLFEGLL